MQNKKILVVDDCEDIRILLSAFLKQFDYDVYVADSGENAIKMLGGRLKIDAVISDVVMPKGDGIWLINKMKDLQINTPLFFITAGTSLDRTQALELGAKDFFQKPIDIEKVITALKSICSYEHAIES